MILPETYDNLPYTDDYLWTTYFMTILSGLQTHWPPTTNTQYVEVKSNVWLAPSHQLVQELSYIVGYCSVLFVSLYHSDIQLLLHFHFIWKLKMITITNHNCENKQKNTRNIELSIKQLTHTCLFYQEVPDLIHNIRKHVDILAWFI